ncbi:MAG: hypothetical protein ACRDDO_06095, partial [Plesiomonas shigelloides]
MMQIRLLPRTAVQVMTRPAAPSGLDGWTPVFSVVIDGLRRVLQVTNWTGGQGGKPITGYYVGPNGLIEDIAQAVDIRGAPGDVTPAAAILLAQAQSAATDAGASKDAAASSALNATGSASAAAISAQNASASASSAVGSALLAANSATAAAT